MRGGLCFDMPHQRVLFGQWFLQFLGLISGLDFFVCGLVLSLPLVCSASVVTSVCLWICSQGFRLAHDTVPRSSLTGSSVAALGCCLKAPSRPGALGEVAGFRPPAGFGFLHAKKCRFPPNLCHHPCNSFISFFIAAGPSPWLTTNLENKKDRDASSQPGWSSAKMLTELQGGTRGQNKTTQGRKKKAIYSHFGNFGT